MADPQNPSGFSQVGGVSWSDTVGDLGDRSIRRPEPRLGIGLAGVGMLMVVFGVVVWAGDHAARAASDDGEADTTLGIILSLVVIAAGMGLLFRFRSGPLANAGVVASALGVPLLMGFATFDDPATSSSGFGDEATPVFALPFSIDAIALFSIAAWLVAYLWVPHARGRTFYLAATTVFTWLYLAEKVEEGAAGYLALLPFSVFFRPLESVASEFGTEEEFFSLPDAATIGWISLLVGLAYYGAAVALDRRGRRGAATPFLAVGAVVVPVGIAHLGGDLEAIGCGLLLVLVGSGLAYYGALQGRRFTTWGWCAGAALGVLLIAGDLSGDSSAAFGIAAILLGAGVIALAQVIASNLAEPDEMTPGPSTFDRGPKLPPGAPPGAWGGPPGYVDHAGYPVYPSQPGYPAPPSPQQPPQPPQPPPSLEPGTQF